MSSSSVDHAVAVTCAAAARDVRHHSIAALTLLVWNSFLTVDEEVQYIWTMRNGSPFKWVYFFLRYVVTVAQIMQIFVIRHLETGSDPPILCRMWYFHNLSLSLILSTLLEFILASRVFALYNRSRRVGLLLFLIIAMEAAGGLRMLLLQQTATFHGRCLLTQMSKNSGYQTVLVFTVHCTLIGLTSFKYFVALRAGWGRTPLVSLVVRDGSTAYATVVFVLASVVVLSGIKNERGVAIVFWSIALTSISGCRMILSMERFAGGEISTGSPQALFTSEFSLGTLNLDRTPAHHQHVPPLTP